MTAIHLHAGRDRLSDVWWELLEKQRRESEDRPDELESLTPDFPLPAFAVLVHALSEWFDNNKPYDHEDERTLVIHTVLMASRLLPVHEELRQANLSRLGQQARVHTLAAIELAAPDWLEAGP